MATKNRAAIPGAKQKFLANNLFDKSYMVEYVLDATKDPVTSGDIFEIIPIPAKSMVWGVFHEVIVQEGATLTYDIGDGATVDGYVAGANGNAATVGMTSPALTEGTPNTFTRPFGIGKFYSSADTIDIRYNNASTKGKIRVVAMISCFDRDYS